MAMKTDGERAPSALVELVAEAESYISNPLQLSRIVGGFDELAALAKTRHSDG